MKSILISIKPRHCANILNGLKTIEIRKRFPKDYRGLIYIYCTKDMAHILLRNGYFEINHFTSHSLQPFNGKVIARFYCDNVEEIKFNKSVSLYYIDRHLKHSKVKIGEVMLGEMSCLNHKQLDDYLQEENGYAIHISKLEIFDTPKELSEFWLYNTDTKKYGMPKTWKKRLTRPFQSYGYIEVEE